MQTYSAKSGSVIRLGANGDAPIENLPPVDGQPGAVLAPAPVASADYNFSAELDAYKQVLFSAVIGAAGGAAIGALTGYFTGRKTTRGAIAGSLVGASAGYAFKLGANMDYAPTTRRLVIGGLMAATGAGGIYYAMK